MQAGISVHVPPSCRRRPPHRRRDADPRPHFLRLRGYGRMVRVGVAIQQASGVLCLFGAVSWNGCRMPSWRGCWLRDCCSRRRPDTRTRPRPARPAFVHFTHNRPYRLRANCTVVTTCTLLCSDCHNHARPDRRPARRQASRPPLGPLAERASGYHASGLTRNESGLLGVSDGALSGSAAVLAEAPSPYPAAVGHPATTART
jgi:hypothetical protein